MDLEGRCRGAQHAGELGRQGVVPGRPGPCEPTELRRGMNTRRHGGLAYSGQGRTAANEMFADGGRVLAGRSVELDLAQEYLRRGGAGSDAVTVQVRNHPGAVTGEVIVRAHQEQLVLDADGEVSSWSERDQAVRRPCIDRPRGHHDGETASATVSPRAAITRWFDVSVRSTTATKFATGDLESLCSWCTESNRVETHRAEPLDGDAVHAPVHGIGHAATRSPLPKQACWPRRRKWG